MAKYLDYDGLASLWARISDNFVKKTGSKSETVTGDKKFTGTTTIGGTNISAETATIIGTNQNVTKFAGSKIIFGNGATFVGTAAAAGLCTRGICGTDTTGTSKSELYLNYDGNNNYSRKVVLGAGGPGESLGPGCGYLYSAIRGDEMKAYVAAQGFTKNTGTMTGITMNGKSYDPKSGIVDLGTVLTAHQSLDGKQDKLVAGTNININGATISATIPAAGTTTTGGIKTGFSATGAKLPVKTDAGNGYVEVTKTALHNAGFGEAFLSWGGRNFSGSYGPIDAAMIPDLGADRFAFTPASCWVVEYSRDGGTTWTDYGASDSQKLALTSTGANFTIGKADSSNLATESFMLRLTLTTTGKIYSVLNKFALYVSTNGSNGCYCTIQGRTKANLDAGNDTWSTFANKIGVSGWSGWNIINTSGITTHGNSANQYANLRFTFGCTSGSTKYVGLQIYKIKAFGGVGWSTPSNMAKYGTIYSYDYGQNVTFPANVYANRFYAKNSAGSYVSTILEGDSRLTNPRPASDVYAWAKASTKPAYTASEVGVTEAAFPGLNKVGTITEVMMNGKSFGTSGAVNLGTVITEHQDISGKQDSLTASQLNAVNSGIMSSKVTTYDNLSSHAWRDDKANTGGAIDTHPENGGAIIGYYTNDLAFLAQRGGSARMTNTTTDTVVWDLDKTNPTASQANIFDGSPSYYNFAKLGSTSETIVVLIKSPVQYYWGTQIGIGFGSRNWRAKNIKIEMGYSATNKGTAQSPDSDIVWVTRAEITNFSQGLYYGAGNGPSAAEGGTSSYAWSYMRLTLTNFNTVSPRIAQIFTINYGSKGMHNTFFPKNGGEIYGNIDVKGTTKTGSLNCTGSATVGGNAAISGNATVGASLKVGGKSVLTTDDKTALEKSIAGKADSAHMHSIGDVNGLQQSLEGKAAKNHTHNYQKAKLVYDSSAYSMSITYDNTATGSTN